MAYIGKQPAVAALTASDITDGIVSNAKLAQDIISADTELAVAPASTDELLISDAGILKRIDYSLIGGDNTPTWHATMSASQSGITNPGWTKVSYNTETWDSDTAYDNSTNYRFTVPTNEDGKYLINASVHFDHSVGDSLEVTHIGIYKNGSLFNRFGLYNASKPTALTQSITAILSLVATDYVEIFAYANAAAGTVSVTTGVASYFSGFKLL